MPEIIQFSNKHWYEPEGRTLYPLRQYLENRLSPLEVRYVPGGVIKGSGQYIANIPEAEAIVEKLAECLENEKYNKKTFGVIAEMGFDVVQDTGQKFEYGAKRSALIRRPNQARIEFKRRDGVKGVMVLDGKERR